MNISPEILKRYLNNRCSNAEVKQIQEWLDSTEDELSDLTPPQTKRLETNVWQKLSEEIHGSNSPHTIPMYKKLARYAAATCIIFMVFFGGRFSAITANANMMVDKSQRDLLYITGGDGAKGSLPGDSFKVRFTGTIRLYNSSLQQKSIQVGDTSFILEPSREYYLIGSVAPPRLYNGDIQNELLDEASLEGDFSILRLDNK